MLKNLFYMVWIGPLQNIWPQVENDIILMFPLLRFVLINIRISYQITDSTSLVSELSVIAGQEKIMLDECRELLATAAKLQVLTYILPNLIRYALDSKFRGYSILSHLFYIAAFSTELFNCLSTNWESTNVHYCCPIFIIRKQGS